MNILHEIVTVLFRLEMKKEEGAALKVKRLGKRLRWNYNFFLFCFFFTFIFFFTRHFCWPYGKIGWSSRSGHMTLLPFVEIVLCLVSVSTYVPSVQFKRKYFLFFSAEATTWIEQF